MKRIIFFWVCLMCSILLGQNDVLNIAPVRTEAQKLFDARTEAPPDQAFDLSQLRELHRAIVGNRPAIWEMPQPMIEAIQDELEPLRPIAKQLAQSERSDERYYGAILNSYLMQTNETRGLLLELARDERPETAGAAMDTLFGLKLDTQDLRAELVQALQEDVPPRKHSAMHSLARNSAGKWNLTEAVPALIALAEKTYQTEKRIDSVVKQLNLLGPAAAQALPTLHALLEKRRSDGGADFREIEALEHAIGVISGEYEAPQQESPSQLPPVSTPLETTPPALKKTPDTQPLPTTPAEESPSPTRWPVAVVVVAAALGMLWVLLKKRK